MGRKLVILGGGNTEREVSQASAQAVSDALHTLSHEHILLDPSQTNFLHQLQLANPDYVINMLHGGWGEGGGAQKLLEDKGIQHSSTSSQTAAFLTNKAKSMVYARKLKIPCPKFQILTKHAYKKHHHFPHIVQQIQGSGSSLGTAKIKNKSEQTAYISCWQDNQSRLITKFIHGIEYSAAFLNNKCIGGVKLAYDAEYYDYHTKYNVDPKLIHRPECLKLHDSYQQAKQMGLKLYTSLHLKGLVRMDFMIEYKTGIPYFLEVNPNPGMTNSSITPDIAYFSENQNYSQLIKLILTTGGVYD